VGLANSATQLVAELQAPSPEAAIERATAGFQEFMAQLQATLQVPPKLEARIEDFFEAGLGIASDIVSLPVRFPQPTGRVFEALGRFVSTPFDWLGGWMLYTLLVAIAAQLMGGRASVQQILGLTALHAAPHLLGILPPLLGLIPAAGPTLEALTGVVVALATWIWSTLIYVAATAVASRFDWARGLLAVLAPVLTLVVLMLVVGIAGLLALLLGT
jgi:hypothetical protein